MLRPFSFPIDEYHEYWKETKDMLRRLFLTKNDITATVGAIRVAFDVIISNIMEPEDKVLVLTNGYWGNYVERVVKSYNGIPILHRENPTSALDPKKIRDELARHKDLKAVTVMHVETDTGSVNPVGEIGELVRAHSDALYVVDCATSLGGMKVEADKWKADCCFSGSHKCLSSPVGLAFITTSNRTQNVIEKRRTPILGSYNNLLPWKDLILGECGPPLPITTIHAVRARLDYIFAHGPEKIFKRHEIAAEAMRSGILEMGLELLSESPQALPCSNVVTVVRFPTGVKKEEVSRIMRKRYHVGFALSPYREEVFQIGTINEKQVNPKHILYFLTSLGLTLSELGVKIKLEQAIRKADEILQRMDKT
jgi:alanine-glyoxylate transaminase/serine-glyoxylate transaminase/serine-pyruvate transaminase